ncbi:MAG TPA: hypothetical protein VGM79_05730, partial [Streptosporangiaceae bacterium]
MASAGRPVRVPATSPRATSASATAAPGRRRADGGGGCPGSGPGGVLGECGDGSGRGHLGDD